MTDLEMLRADYERDYQRVLKQAQEAEAELATLRAELDAKTADLAAALRQQAEFSLEAGRLRLWMERFLQWCTKECRDHDHVLLDGWTNIQQNVVVVTALLW